MIPARFVLYFFDDVSIRDPGDLSRIRTAAARQLGVLQPGDRVGIVSSSCRLTLDFTNDPAKLQEAVSRLELHPAPVCRVSVIQKLQVELLKTIVGKMSQLPARREIIVVSPGFFVGADRSSELDDLIETAVRSKVLPCLLHSFTYTVFMKNITLSVDEKVLAVVRRHAAEKNSSINALVRDYLTNLATQENRANLARARLRELSARSSGRLGKKTWTREDLHDRQSLS